MMCGDYRAYSPQSGAANPRPLPLQRLERKAQELTARHAVRVGGFVKPLGRLRRHFDPICRSRPVG